MPEIIEEHTETVKNKEICNIRLIRGRGGIKIIAKSEMLEDFFKGLSNNSTATGDSSIWGRGMNYYKIPSLPIENDGNYHRPPTVMEWGTTNIIDLGNSRSNFSFVRAVGIKDGIEITYPGLFLARDIERFKEDFKRFLTKFYVDYMKVSEFELTVRTSI